MMPKASEQAAKAKHLAQGLKARWAALGGQYKRYTQKGPLCQSFCKHWIADRLAGRGGLDLIGGITDEEAERKIRRHQNILRVKTKVPFLDTYSIPGAKKIKEGRKFLGFGTLRSWDDVLDKMFQEPGVYMVVGDTPAYALSSFGHAVAFDTTPNIIYFFDPNSGQYWLGAFDQDHYTVNIKDFRDWFTSYLGSELWPFSYKDRFHHGGKRLRRYVPADGRMIREEAIKEEVEEEEEEA